ATEPTDTGYGFDVIAGSEKTPTTASESFVVNGVDHNELVDAFTSFVESAQDNSASNLNERFSLGHLWDGQPDPFWIPDRFMADGTSRDGTPGPGYEAVMSVVETSPPSTPHYVITDLSYYLMPHATTLITRHIVNGQVVTQFRQTAGSSSGTGSS